MLQAAVIFGALVLLAGMAALALMLIRRKRGNSATVAHANQQISSTAPTLYRDSDGQPLVEVSRVEFPIQERREDIPLNPRIATSLSNLIPRLAPVTGSIANVALTSGTYVMRFSPDVAEGLAGGTLKLMKAVGGGFRASAVPVAGSNIAGNATLFSATTTHAVAASMAVWQIAAFVVAQKYLADINDHLKRIETEIHSIREWLDNDRHGKLRGDLDYLKMISRELVEGELSEQQVAAYVASLEQIELGCMEIMGGVRLQLQSEMRGFEAQQLKGSFLSVSVEHSDAARKAVSIVKDLVSQFLLGEYVRCIANQLKCALPINRRSVLSRLSELREQHVTFKDSILGFQSLVEKRIPELKGSLTWVSTDAEQQGKLKEHLTSAAGDMMQVWHDIGQVTSRTMDAIQRDLDTANQPLKLAVSVDSAGSITGVQRIVEAV
jgi:hypothetical protein